MKLLRRKPLVKVIHALVASTALSIAGHSFAQETSSGLKGFVKDSQGMPLSNASVTITNKATGYSRTVTTNDNGLFRVNNLPISSDYVVTASGDGYQATKSDRVAVNLGESTNLDFALQTGDATMEEMMVYAEQDKHIHTAVGPSATFGLETLQTAPSFNRDIADVMRIDPRIHMAVDNSNATPIQCGGKNSRFNSLTLDGVRMNDAFGLNDNGYPTERLPFSYDAINQVAVELAPFDVEYGGFTACNINAVTKSGSNEFHGSAFYDYTGDSFQGDSLEGDDIETGDFTEKRMGFTLGGPLIEDKLFFFVAYEKLEGANVFDRGPQGSGAVNEINVTQAQLDEITDIARTLYNYDPGSIPSSLDNDDEKLLMKVDANLTDTQRLSVTYNYNDGNNFTESDGDLDEFEFDKHLYERGAELKSWSATLYSDWTENFSTEMRLGYLELDNRQISVGGTEFGEIRVDTGEVDVYLGGDDSRQSNDLDYDVTNLSLKGKYLLEDHTLSFGYEREKLDIFNLFIQHTQTEIRFNSINDFRNGDADRIYYNNAPSGNPNDAAADWGYATNTLFIQDEWDISPSLTLAYGLRYDFYSTSDEPALNQDFLSYYGYGNDHTLDGESLLQPRIGFSYDVNDQLSLHGGIGIFSGGNPNVWLSNTYSNNNVLQFGARIDDVNVFGLNYVNGNGPGYGVPEELANSVATGTGSNFEINALDPDFEIPSEMKIAFGGSYLTENNYLLSADILFSRSRDSAIVLRGDLEQTGTNAEGYPIYDSVREPSFLLTNSSEDADALLVSFNVSKSYDNGFDWSAGYAYSDAEDIQPMNSAVAFSNYQNRAFFDPQEQVASTSSYNIEHRFTASLNYRHEFVEGYATKVSLFLQSYQGPSYSLAVPGNGIYNYTPFLEGNNVLLPGSSRNSEDGSWWTKADLRIEQELPGFSADHRASAYMVVDNLSNLLNDDWGIHRQADFPGNVEPGQQAEARLGESSLYKIRLGISYNF